jgi:predicted transcriptional regulator
MARNFEELRAKMSPERRTRNRRETQKMLAEIALQDLRQSLNLTQTQVADVLAINQAAVSKMEGQGDMYVTTLRRYIEALGGHLKLVASFPEREVVINQFDESA